MRNINLSASHASLLKYHHFFFFFFSILVTVPFASIGCSANGACLHHSHDVIVVIRIACDCNCRLVRIPVQGGIGAPFSNRRDGISAALPTRVFLVDIVVIAIAIVSLSPSVPPMAMQLSHVDYGMSWPVTKQQEAFAFRFSTNFVFSPILNTTNSNEPRFKCLPVVRHVFFIGYAHTFVHMR